jgi:hypothetical protein
MAVRNPLGSLPLEGFRAFQTANFIRRTRSLNAQAQGRIMFEGAEVRRRQAEELRQQSLGLHERFGQAIDRAPIIGGLKQGGMTVLKGVGAVLGAPQRAIAGGVLAAVRGENPLVGAGRGFLDLDPDINFATVLEETGMDSEPLRNVLGFALDMLTDPFNLLVIPAIGGRVAMVAGKISARAVAGTAKVPGVEVIAERAARFFSPRLGLGQAGTTHWNLRLQERKGLIKAGAAEKIISADRVLRNYARDAEGAAVREVMKKLATQRYDDALREGLTDEEAIKVTTEFMTAMRTNADLTRELSEQARKLREKGTSWKKAEEEGLFEKIGLTAADMPGATSFLRFLRAGFGSMDGKLGEWAAMKESMGVTSRWSDIYVPTSFSDARDISNAVNGATGLRERALGARYARQELSPTFVKTAMDTNILAVIAHDIAQTRISFYMKQILDDDMLGQLGTKVFNRATYQNRLTQLTARGINARHVQDLALAGVSAKEIVEELAQTQIRAPGRAGLEPARKIVRFSDERGKSIGRSDDALIREVVENSQTPGRTFYNPDPTKLYMKDAEIADLASKGLVPDPGLPSAVRWLLPEEITKSFDMFNKPFELGTFFRAVDTFNSFWKQTVTVMPPGVLAFLVRNGTGLTLKVGEAGVPFWKVPAFMPDAARMMKSNVETVVKKVEVPFSERGRARWAERTGKDQPSRAFTHEELAREFQEHGGISVGSRNVQPPKAATDPVTAAPRSRLGRIGAAILGRRPPTSRNSLDRHIELLAKYDQTLLQEQGWKFPIFAMGHTANQGMDNFARWIVGLWRLSEGDTIPQAARHAAHWIGDYTELGAATPAIAAALPFFRWTRFNIGTTVEALFKRPYMGSKASLGGMADTEDDLLRAEVDSLPEWVLERHHALLGKDEDGRMRVLYGLGLPIEDLNKLFALNIGNTADNWLSEMTPILRAPLEWKVDYSFFTGEPISNKEKPWNFYNRAWGWTTKLPGLKNWLKLEQIESRTGRIFYRADPMRMYVFSAILGRLGNEVDKIGRIAEERNGLTALNFASGVKFAPFFPEPPSRASFSEGLNRNPLLRAKFDELQNIPLYPQFGDPALSAQAARAINRINNVRRALEATSGQEATFEEAAAIYGHSDAQGEGLALMVRANGWTQTGKTDRAAFRKNNPLLAIAQAQLTPEEFELIFDLAIQP